MVERNTKKGINKGFNYNVYSDKDGFMLIELYYNDYLFCTSAFDKYTDPDALAAKIVYEYLNCDHDAITTNVLFKRMSERYF